jgi:branched-chain amino acid transport system ATP-binding protein
VRQGEFVGIIGSNGAGKTSTLRAITGVKAPAGGSISFAGQPIAGLPSHVIVARGIAMVPEGRQVFADQTVEDNLMLGAYVRTGQDDTGVQDDMDYVLGSSRCCASASRSPPVRSPGASSRCWRSPAACCRARRC